MAAISAPFYQPVATDSRTRTRSPVDAESAPSRDPQDPPTNCCCPTRTSQTAIERPHMKKLVELEFDVLLSFAAAEHDDARAIHDIVTVGRQCPRTR